MKLPGRRAGVHPPKGGLIRRFASARPLARSGEPHAALALVCCALLQACSGAASPGPAAPRHRAPAERGRGVERLRVVERPRPEGYPERWMRVVTHTHNLRTGETGFEDAKGNLLAWARRHALDAVGVGSPWEPVSKAHYEQYEGPDRDLYYSDRIAPSSVMDRQPIEGFFEELNRRSGHTLFYQDNETPKNRYGHLWYVGYHYTVPAWHDYTQDRPVKHYRGDPHVERNAVTGRPHWRRSCLEVAWSQRSRGAVPVWAHPTSWWGEGDDFTTNIAAESLLHLLVDGGLDGLSVMGYQAFHPAYQALWFHYLDTGARIPGFAETDLAFDARRLPPREEIYKNYVAIDGPPVDSSDELADAVRRRPHFASTGPYIEITADGVAMGGRVETRPGTVHRVRVEAYPVPGQHELARVEIIGKGGETLATVERFGGGVIELDIEGRREPHYVLARAFGRGDDPDGPPESVRDHAITNPVYFHPEGFRFEPVRTEVTLEVDDDSPWVGRPLELQRADGTVIERLRPSPGTLRRTVPGNARIRLASEGDGDDEGDDDGALFYIAVENPDAQRVMRYLYDGEFLDDHPQAEPGQVPPAAFRIEAMREALQTFRYELSGERRRRVRPRGGAGR